MCMRNETMLDKFVQVICKFCFCYGLKESNGTSNSSSSNYFDF